MSEPVHSVHPAIWERLSQANPKDVCRRSGAQFDDATGSYVVSFLQEFYRVGPQTKNIELLPGSVLSTDPSIELQVILITYLLNAHALPLVNRLVAGSGLKGGKTFFQGAHRLPVEPLVEQFGMDPTGFINKGLSLGAQQERYGDAGLRFSALPRVPVIMVLWQGDKEYPARLSVLFDASIAQHLPLDAIYGLVIEICRRMADR
jgi:hypothetical protein